MKRGHNESSTDSEDRRRGRSLEQYNEMRDFHLTAEPSATAPLLDEQREVKTSDTGHSFVVQKHAARRLHYDFRLELDGVLLSWAVPKGPSLMPGDKRLAVQVEDHPLDYRDFEGTIPKGQYGGGAVIVWDRGTWTPIGDPHAGLKKGHLDFELQGEKLGGRYVLVRTRQLEGAKKPSWLLIKRSDEWAVDSSPNGTSVVDQRPESILTGRTIEDIFAGVPATAAKKTKTKAKTKTRTKARATKAAPKVSGAKLPPFGSIAPQLATLVKSVPTSGPWVYEIKYDGYRTLAWLDNGKVRMASRRGLDWTDKYENIANALASVLAASATARARNAIFDGEVAYVMEDGRTSFQKLQNALGRSRARGRAAAGEAARANEKERGRLVYFIFDLLFYDGVDLRDQPLSFRKDKLRTILAGEKPPLKLSDHVEDGEAFFREACKLELEGIIGKRTDRPYVSKRTPDWVKVKCQNRQEFVIVGFTSPKAARGRAAAGEPARANERERTGIGALYLGTREGGTTGKDKKTAGTLRCAGKVGTGFSNATLRDLSQRLGKIIVDEPPVTNPPRRKDVTWVKPELVAEVRFAEWTSDGVLRHPSFEGLRLDKTSREVERERAREVPSNRKDEDEDHAVKNKPTDDGKPRVHGILISHPDRVIDIDTGLTKLDLARYAGEVAGHMLPYISNRPLMLLRCPSGTHANVPMGQGRPADRRHSGVRRGSGCFVQKHSGQGLSGTELGKTMIKDEEAIFVTTEREIVTLAQNNTVELHGWGSRLPKWDRPDWIVLDLDPDEALAFKVVIDAALELRGALRSLGLESWVKTTGGKGLHVVVPLARRYDWPTVRRVSEQIAILMTRANPTRYVATMTKKARTGKIFVDYLRNAEGATAVLPYSARARPGLTVALPIAWNELKTVDPKELTIVTVPKLLARRRTDPWSDLLETKQTLRRELIEASLK